MDQELVTRFTADISQYKKSMASLQAEAAVRRDG